MTYRPTVLVIMDGWGIGADAPSNAVQVANTPVLDRLQATYPTTSLRTSGRDAGLPDGQMGNSEVGHLNLGAGFVVYQWITRIDTAIEDGSFFENQVLLNAISWVKRHGSKLHLMGLVGDGGVHASQQHLVALLELAARHDLTDVFIHAFTDGRDTRPTSGAGFIKELIQETRRIGTGTVASISGRYYAMDRDRRWERTEQAYRAIVDGIGVPAIDPVAAIQESYATGVTDEFIRPIVLQNPHGKPIATLQTDDAVVYFNFRSDRARQLTEALAATEFTNFDVSTRPTNLFVGTMTQYEATLPVQVVFPPHDVDIPLAKVISDAGLNQMHAAETEKYAHVTYFFNGGREDQYPGEDRLLIPSPKVPTYDLKPEMSAHEITDGVVKAIESGTYAFIIVNYANGDMVGHTGVFDAAVKAIETVDSCVGRITAATLRHGGAALITADHGNAEEMTIPGTDQVWTAHTTNPVPFVLVVPDTSPLRHRVLRQGGRLADVTPTVLELLGLSRPESMTGQPLFSPTT